jgi:hypothetical protein
LFVFVRLAVLLCLRFSFSIAKSGCLKKRRPCHSKILGPAVSFNCVNRLGAFGGPAAALLESPFARIALQIRQSQGRFQVLGAPEGGYFF